MMAQTITTLCDLHLADGAEAPGQPYRMALGPPGANLSSILVDLCELHAAAIVEAFQALELVGRPDGMAPKGRAEDAPAVCPICAGEYKNRGSMGAHLRQMHGKTLGELSGRKRKGDSKCPVCGRTLGSPQGLGAHVRSAHGMSVDEARASSAPKAKASRRRSRVTEAPPSEASSKGAE